MLGPMAESVQQKQFVCGLPWNAATNFKWMLELEPVASVWEPSVVTEHILWHRHQAPSLVLK